LIKLTKGPVPDFLAQNADNWLKELLAEVANGGDKIAYRKSKYNNPAIKAALIAETNGKCAYCESLPLHVTYGDIEHIMPKSVDPNLTFDWQNLTLACDICNTKKADKEGLIDPYEDEPEDEFNFIGPMILHRAGKAKAEITRTVLDLNRSYLLCQRAERIEALENKFRLIEQHPEPEERELMLAATVEHEMSAERGYSLCSRSYLRATERYKAP
jgi:uncharacterized protein (TIGR02646 family)